MLIQENKVCKILITQEVRLRKTHLISDHKLDVFELWAYIWPHIRLGPHILKPIFQSGIQPSWSDHVVFLPFLPFLIKIFEIDNGNSHLYPWSFGWMYKIITTASWTFGFFICLIYHMHQRFAISGATRLTRLVWILRTGRNLASWLGFFALAIHWWITYRFSCYYYLFL